MFGFTSRDGISDTNMQFVYTPPPLPSLARWRKLYRSYGGRSVLRALQYETLQQQTIQGRVLDVGGGEKAGYMKYLTDVREVHSVNIDSKLKPTFLLKPGEPFPVEDSSYDNAVSMNTFEHIYDVRFVLNETFRALRPGGTLYASVPWIYGVHGDPHDYFRATHYWWRETLQEIGFAQVEVQPLIWGRFTSGGLISSYRACKRLPRGQFTYLHFKDWLYAKILFRGSTYDGPRGERICNIAPGYFIWAKR